MRFGIFQDAITLIEHMRNVGATVGDIERFLLVEAPRRRRWQRGVRKEFLKKLPDCPKCRRKMHPYEVNTNPRNQVGGGFKTQLICECGHEEFNSNDFSRYTINAPPDTKLARKFEAFRSRDLYQIMGVFAWAELNGLSFDDLGRIVQNMNKWRPVRLISKPCPQCEGIMKLSVADEIEQDSQWLCKNCGFGEYVPKPFWEVIRDGE